MNIERKRGKKEKVGIPRELKRKMGNKEIYVQILKDTSEVPHRGNKF